MKVKVKRLHEDAVIPFKKYDNDMCYDVIAVSEQELAPNVWRYELGLAFQIDRSKLHIIYDNACLDFNALNINLDIDFRPRSSVWETGMVLSNCEGTIDENFIGGVSAVFYHVMPNMERYHVGNKIGQIKIGFTLPMEFEEVDELSETDRGANGYGHTGK